MAKLIVISKGLSKNLTLLQVATFTFLLQKPSSFYKHFKDAVADKFPR